VKVRLPYSRTNGLGCGYIVHKQCKKDAYFKDVSFFVFRICLLCQKCKRKQEPSLEKEEDKKEEDNSAFSAYLQYCKRII
jgi:hypothetical protein